MAISAIDSSSVTPENDPHYEDRINLAAAFRMTARLGMDEAVGLATLTGLAVLGGLAHLSHSCWKKMLHAASGCLGFSLDMANTIDTLL